MSQVSTKEPLFHIVKREGVTFVRASLIRLVAILLALVVCAFVIMGMTGMNPLSVYAGIWSGAVGTARRTWVTLRDSAILLCIGFAVLPAFRMRFWNIGAEGQVLVGAMATAAVMIYGADLPSLGAVRPLPHCRNRGGQSVGHDSCVFQGPLEHQ